MAGTEEKTAELIRAIAARARAETLLPDHVAEQAQQRLGELLIPHIGVQPLPSAGHRWSRLGLPVKVGGSIVALALAVLGVRFFLPDRLHESPEISSSPSATRSIPVATEQGQELQLVVAEWTGEEKLPLGQPLGVWVSLLGWSRLPGFVTVELLGKAPQEGLRFHSRAKSWVLSERSLKLDLRDPASAELVRFPLSIVGQPPGGSQKLLLRFQDERFQELDRAEVRLDFVETSGGETSK